jgi:predicted Zn-dependent protease
MKSRWRAKIAGAGCVAAFAITNLQAQSDIEVRVMPHDLAVTANEIEQWFADQNMFAPDSALLRYIDSIKTHIVVANNIAAGTYSIRLLRSTEPNAHSFVNGSIYICTAVLGMMTDEAQLAMLLAHEIAHISLGHHVKARYELHQQSREVARRQVASSFFIGGLAGVVSNQSLRRAMCGFSREQEAAAITFFTILDRWLLDEKPTVQDPDYATHPELVDRFQACRVSLVESGQDTTTVASDSDGSSYRARIRNLLVTNAREFCREGKYSLALTSLADSSLNTLNNPQVLCERAKIFANRNNPADLDSCVKLYNRALTLQPTLYPAERELGYALLKLGKKSSARSALNRYLGHKPAAPDTGFVRLYLRGCQ